MREVYKDLRPVRRWPRVGPSRAVNKSLFKKTPWGGELPLNQALELRLNVTMYRVRNSRRRFEYYLSSTNCGM